MTKAKELSLKKTDKTTFYKNVITTNRSMSDMTHEEFSIFLREAYKDVNDIQLFVSEYILNVE